MKSSLAYLQPGPSDLCGVSQLLHILSTLPLYITLLQFAPSRILLTYIFSPQTLVIHSNKISEGLISDWLYVTSGVPQGHVLELVLTCIYDYMGSIVRY